MSLFVKKIYVELHLQWFLNPLTAHTMLQTSFKLDPPTVWIAPVYVQFPDAWLFRSNPHRLAPASDLFLLIPEAKTVPDVPTWGVSVRVRPLHIQVGSRWKSFIYPTTFARSDLSLWFGCIDPGLRYASADGNLLLLLLGRHPATGSVGGVVPSCWLVVSVTGNPIGTVAWLCLNF